MEIEILRGTTGFTFLTASVYDSVTRVVGLIHHTLLVYIINGPPVCKIINPSPCLPPMSLKKKTEASGTVPQVSYNNGRGTQSLTHTTCGSAPDYQ